MQAEAARRMLPAWVAYVAPIAAFGAIGEAERISGGHYPLVYALKALLVTGVLIACRSTWRDLRPDRRVLAPAVLVGLAVLAEWVLLSVYVPYPRAGARVAFDPYSSIASPARRAAFIAVRFYGLALMVPLMEELFWRSFLIRALSRYDWVSMPVGTFSRSAFWAIALAFGAVHPEWLVAVICGVAYGWLLWRTRSVFACFVAHAVTNLGLGIYVLVTHAWVFW